FAGVKRTAGACHLPQFLGDPMHVHGEADAAVTDQGDAQLLVPHATPFGRSDRDWQRMATAQIDAASPGWRTGEVRAPLRAPDVPDIPGAWHSPRNDMYVRPAAA